MLKIRVRLSIFGRVSHSKVPTFRRYGAPQTRSFSYDMGGGARDTSTLSNYDQFRVKTTSVNFSIDFDQQILQGHVVHTVKSMTDAAADSIVLDTSRLDVQGVQIDGRKVEWTLMDEIQPFGQPLHIYLGKGLPRGETIDVTIHLQTTQESSALQFMSPAQTRNKYPYMLSQCQVIHARSIFPCQDTPDVKAVYEFAIASPLPVIASGIPINSSEDLNLPDGQTKVQIFRQDIPIPSYLFAIASGLIQTAPIGPRSVVATSPDMLKAAQWEFEKDTEHFIEELEKLVYPYQWGTYNLLVVPKSFPYGGMENPQFTYVTPTIISKDRQNVDVIAHELSHSFSGNLVTAATWGDFWLNEGWTTYLERRLQAALHGEPHRDFSAIIGWKSLVDSVNEYGPEHEFTKLIPNLKGRDPDDAFSTIPYEKGYTFLSFLEKTAGRDKWNQFIPHYFRTFARQSIDSNTFKESLLEFFVKDSDASTALSNLDWDKWFYSPGLPPKPDFDTSLADVCYRLAKQWNDVAEEHSFEPKPADIEGWSASQVVVFLDEILASSTPLPTARAHLMGQVYDFAASTNCEVIVRYFRVALRSKDESVYQPTATLLGEVGRMKFVRPL